MKTLARQLSLFLLYAFIIVLGSCKKARIQPKICDVAFEGSDCLTEKRLKYFGDYKATGIVHQIPPYNVYLNFGLNIYGDVRSLQFTTNEANMNFYVTLNFPDSTFTVTPYTFGGNSYTGSGYFGTANNFKLEIHERDTTTTDSVIYTFDAVKF